MDVEMLTTVDTYPLRRRVLRDDSPDPAAVVIAGDDEPTSVHLGIRSRDGDLVAVSTWFEEPAPDGTSPATHLRAMAVDESHQGTGIGAMLLRAGMQRAYASGSVIVWANARDTALGFYQRLGFTVEGDGFVDATTGLPHHVVVRHAT